MQEGAGRLDALSVELLVQGRPVNRVTAASDGAFQFDGIPVASYELRVTNLYGDIIRREFISVYGQGNPLLVKLPKKTGVPPGAKTISVSRLLQPVPSKARKEFDRADEAFRQGELADSVQHLQKAIELFPAYVEAHNNLGVRYMTAGNYQGAAAEFQRATELDPAAVLPNTNLAMALLTLKRYEEAEASARRALAADAGFLQARYALGLIAAGRHQCTAEAVESLKKASPKYPKARLIVARLLACRGDTAQAAAELRAYLDLPDAENRQLVKGWLTQLQPHASR